MQFKMNIIDKYLQKEKEVAEKYGEKLKICNNLYNWTFTLFCLAFVSGIFQVLSDSTFINATIMGVTAAAFAVMALLSPSTSVHLEHLNSLSESLLDALTKEDLKALSSLVVDNESRNIFKQLIENK